ncbi:uncharacterized protein C6orf163 homolog [Rhinatrema bivittatum]|uniref:uncharacterized protein C6orf163 homolog n=1 Tax=Rhinatrema bivittatum TaxID=194408 RepID=UPI00112C0710|nr:uncharacterized protein C6orf163 homolog [Rhinatrema bivittatum]
MFSTSASSQFAGCDTASGKAASIGSSFDPLRSYRPQKVRYYTHKDIIEIGTELHKKILEELGAENRRSLETAQAAVQAQAEKEKKKAVKEAIKSVKKEQKVVLEDIEKKRENIIQQAIQEAEEKMYEDLKIEVKKVQEAAELHLADEIKKVLKQCYEEKVEAVAHEKHRQRIIARRAQVLLKREFLQRQRKSHSVVEKRHRKSLQSFKKKAESERKVAVATAQKVEQEKAHVLIKEAEEVQQKELEVLKDAVEEMKVQQVQDVGLLETVESNKHELEEEIEEIREAFQKYIDVTFPMLSPGQADFLLPLRKKYMKEVNEGLIQSPFISTRDIS